MDAGKIRFLDSFQYTDRDMWLKDCIKHCVDADNERFCFKDGEPKFGWTVEVLERYGCPARMMKSPCAILVPAKLRTEWFIGRWDEGLKVEKANPDGEFQSFFTIP